MTYYRTTTPTYLSESTSANVKLICDSVCDVPIAISITTQYVVA